MNFRFSRLVTFLHGFFTLFLLPFVGGVESFQSATCGELNMYSGMPQMQLLEKLTQPCRYDKMVRPPGPETKNKTHPLHITARANIYTIKSNMAKNLQFDVNVMLQLRYVDSRLRFNESLTSSGHIMGGLALSEMIWTPSVFAANEWNSITIGNGVKDLLVSIDPDGTIIISTRLEAMLNCGVQLQKFPFDVQECPLVFESWTHNVSDINLMWDGDNPVALAKELHLTEYKLASFWYNTSHTSYRLTTDEYRRHFAGNYSKISITFKLAREEGFFMMDYYIPSILLVVISWLSFWLHSDASPPRIVLGTSTMLTFITLSSKVKYSIPKVPYIVASEIWFLGCMIFIFAAMIEFGIVNTIYRRKKDVHLKKVNGKHIFKSTLIKPRLSSRPNYRIEHRKSCPNLEKPHEYAKDYTNQNYLTVHSFPVLPNVPTILEEIERNSSKDSIITVETETSTISPAADCSKPLTTMTPQEIAQWIDRRSRIVFPVCFILFNILYWSYIMI